ncbi:hypothetical protein JKP88DRAFT_23290 [Tribonema minus]|uniref:FYVE-type domain-containing protein n=1 Tax=Tribonema minus TaxID=303371 RepID=A0A836CKW8_9STRA|nr:hypothetical protein JKP88DRAFT_41209 [Tribonema minus]KAG5189083.1 hypothetical protein JKP88DRAFT_23290 [Tribonema minus]
MGQAFACCKGLDFSHMQHHFAKGARQSFVLAAAAQQPSWVVDDMQDSCYGCAAEFNYRNRKHHCRRCHNIYCDACTAYREKLLLFGFTQAVRLCQMCLTAAREENSFLDDHLPLLQEGSTFLRHHGYGRKVPIFVKLSPDTASLVCMEPGRGAAGSSLVFLAEVRSVSMEHASTLVLQLQASSTTLKFDACSTNECRAWLEALQAACAWSQRPALKQAVEEARAARWEQLQYAQYSKAAAENRKQRQAAREQMAAKYNISSFSSSYAHRRAVSNGYAVS